MSFGDNQDETRRRVDRRRAERVAARLATRRQRQIKAQTGVAAPDEVVVPDEHPVSHAAPDPLTNAGTDHRRTEERMQQRRRQRRSPRRITRLAQLLNARSYLEIGVDKGVTFNAIDLPRKVAVDPFFHFDIAQFKKDGIDFFQMTSDAFFSRHAGHETFDLIFLDGLHTYEQTFRDFCASLGCSHRRTVWIIDDVFPIDEYSAIPDQAEAREARRAAGITERPNVWHGDVYKVVFAIHDLFPTMNYVTAQSDGRPQTFVWKAPREKFTPLFQKLSMIEQLSYSRMLELKDVLNMQDEEKAYETVCVSLGQWENVCLA